MAILLFLLSKITQRDQAPLDSPHDRHWCVTGPRVGGMPVVCRDTIIARHIQASNHNIYSSPKEKGKKETTGVVNSAKKIRYQICDPLIPRFERQNTLPTPVIVCHAGFKIEGHRTVAPKTCCWKQIGKKHEHHKRSQVCTMRVAWFFVYEGIVALARSRSLVYGGYCASLSVMLSCCPVVGLPFAV